LDSGSKETYPALFLIWLLRKSKGFMEKAVTDNTDTHLEDTSQAKKIFLSKFFDFSIFMSCR